jgi:membrane-associated phospholipid phosphatase
VALLVIAGLVASGATGWLDDLLRDHAAPLAHGPQRSHPFLLTWLNEWLAVDTLLLGPVLSTLIFGAECVLLGSRRERRRALAWGAAFVAALAIELIGKQLVDPGFPSGHVLRSVLIAQVGIELWPRRRAAFYGLVIVTVIAIQLKGIHTISDIAGGLVAGFGLSAAVDLVSPPARSRRSSI